MQVIIEHDSDGRILRWRPPRGEKLNEDASDFETEIESPSDLVGRMVDTESEELVDDPDAEVTPGDDLGAWARQLTTNHPVQRRRVTESTKQDFRDARADENIQTQLDILFEILTGDAP